MFVIAKPDVLHSPNSDTYIIFGEAKIEDFSGQAQQQAAQNFLPPAAQAKPPQAADSAAGASAEGEDDEDVDAEGVEEKDIALVMNQANVSRSKAINALKSTGGDIVTAIMEVTIS